MLLRLIFACVFVGVAFAASVDLCAGLVSDNLSHPQPNMTKPAKGVPFTDPQFGTRIIRITDVKAENGGKAGVRKPMYATIPAWNVDESLMILYQTAGFISNSGIPSQHMLYDGKTYQFKKVLDFYPADLEHIYWDTKDPDALYYPTNTQGSDGDYVGYLYKYKVSTATKEALLTLRRQDVPNPPSAGLNCNRDGSLPCKGWFDFSHPKFMDWSSTLIGVRYRYYYSNGDGMTATFNTVTRTLSPWVYIPGTGGLDKFGVAVAPSGTVGIRGPDIVHPTNMSAFLRPDGSTKLHVNYLEHASLAPLSNGQDVFFGPQYDIAPYGALITENLQTGETRTIIGQANGWGYPPNSIHASGVAVKNPGWVGLSVVGGSPGDGIMSTGIKPLEQEILVANVNTGAYCRVAHHYTARTDQEYWAEPHVVISPSGTRLLFGSDWRNSDSVDTYVVELPSYDSTVVPTSAPTIAPTTKPTSSPTAGPTSAPTTKPTTAPTAGPTSAPTTKPTTGPTSAPTTRPTSAPTVGPTGAPTGPTAPTGAPTAPTAAPTTEPTTDSEVSAGHSVQLSLLSLVGLVGAIMFF